MAGFISGGRVLDLVLACISIEILVLVCYRLGKQAQLLPADVLANLCAAAGLVAAARLLIVAAWWGYVGVALTGALFAHVLALRLRWPRAPGVWGVAGHRAFSPRSAPVVQARSGPVSFTKPWRIEVQHHIPASRALMKSLAVGAAALLAIGPVPKAFAATAAALVPLTSADPTAKALGYVDDSSKVVAAANPMHKPEQNCSNCVQFKGKPGDARGGCNIYPGKSVSSKGRCKVYAKKAAPAA
jgi:hypothetical protein